jgi:glutathione-regulated potassium-efflux system ancillary protein KefG
MRAGCAHSRRHAHSDPASSRHNAALLAAARGVPGVTAHDLTAAYPGFAIAVEREKALPRVHDTLVLRFPMHWCSSPALTKQWLDLTLEHGFAYGPGGDALRGERCWVAATVAGPPHSYGGSGRRGFDVRHGLPTFLAFLGQAALVCGMVWEEPFVVDRAVWDGLSDEELAVFARAYAARLAKGAGSRDAVARPPGRLP